MTLRDQIEARTNAANTSSVGALKTVRERERERRRHHYKHETQTARDCLALHLMSPMRRGRVTVMIEITKCSQTISK